MKIRFDKGEEDPIKDLVNVAPEFKTPLPSKLEFSTDEWIESYALPEIIDIENDYPCTVSVKGLPEFIDFDNVQNIFKFSNSSFTKPGTFLSDLKIVIKDNRGKESDEISFRIVITKKKDEEVCSLIPKTVPDS